MNSNAPRPWVRILAVVALATLLAWPATAASRLTGLRLEPARTWVGIARVLLEVDDLQLVGHELVGRYEIRVPLAPSEDDRGRIRMAPGSSLEALVAEGGRILGSVTSDFNGKTHGVECSLTPDGRVEIVVTTDRRVLSFKTRHEGR